MSNTIQNNSVPRTPDSRISSPPAKSNPYGGVEKANVLSSATSYLHSQQAEKNRGAKGK